MNATYDEELAFEVRSTATGFRLYHPARGCYLATTFRSFKSNAALSSNDSMLHELHSELEVSCVQLANEQASTFYVIEGGQILFINRHSIIWLTDFNLVGYHQNQNRALSWLARFVDESSLVQAFRRGVAIMATMRRLYVFRKDYHGLQDVPVELLRNSAAHHSEIVSSLPSMLLSGLLPAVSFAALALHKQRLRQSRRFWSSLRGQGLLILAITMLVHRLGDSSIDGLEYIMCSRCAVILMTCVICYPSRNNCRLDTC